MPASPLTPEQLQDAARLKRILKEKKDADKSWTQERLAHECGWKNQSAAQQYINGNIPLNLDALIKISLLLNVPAEEISPTLAIKIVSAAKLSKIKV